MADQKISELTEVTSPATSDMLALVEGGVTKKASIANIRKVMEWDQWITTTIVQDVTNTVTLASNSELTFAMVAGEVWYIELLLVYSGSDTTVDIRINCVLPASSEGSLTSIGLGTGNAAQVTNLAATAAAIFGAGTDVTLGTLAGGNSAYRSARFEMNVVAGASSAFTVQQANSTAGVGRISRIGIGSLLRAHKLA
jgi:hypothetical protein